MSTTPTTEVAGAAHEAAKAGMPQLDFSTFPNQIFWLLVTLGVIYFVLSRVALPRIGGTIANRKGTITADLSAAEELKQKAVEAEAAYDEALATARSEAAKIIAANKAENQADLAKAIAKADADHRHQNVQNRRGRIDEIKAGAVAAVEAVAKDTAAELVGALGGTADAKAISAAVAARLKG
ncbi:MAG: F0F1 ATP synthase subunit B' [Cypionkella sp.]|nr:F0F1 ATP synthase subunit B' [Cypionkella sp.]